MIYEGVLMHRFVLFRVPKIVVYISCTDSLLLEFKSIDMWELVKPVDTLQGLDES